LKRKRWWLLALVVVLLGTGGWFATHRGPDPTLAGQVTRIAVKEGDRVKKGQFLLQIDPANPRAAARGSEASMQALLRDLDSSRASREHARLDFRRAQENHDASIIANADLDRARTALATAEAAVQAAERRVEQAKATLEGAQDVLSKTTVVAPMDGVVTAKRVEEGEVAVVGVLNQPGTVLLTVSDMSVVETEMEVDETSIPTVKVGQEARIRIDAYPNQTFDGVVTEVGSSPIMKAGAGQGQNEAIMKNGLWKPGAGRAAAPGPAHRAHLARPQPARARPADGRAGAQAVPEGALDLGIDGRRRGGGAARRGGLRPRLRARARGAIPGRRRARRRAPRGRDRRAPQRGAG
jgi:RND family efflux transporter MFP subunit